MKFEFLYGIIFCMRKGKIIPNGVVLETHEMAAVVFLTEMGCDVELVPKSNKYGEHSPDIKMARLFWEIKCPRGRGKYLIQNILHKAARQSENVIIDLRAIKMHPYRAMAEIQKEFTLSKRIKRLKVITKAGKLIDFSK